MFKGLLFGCSKDWLGGFRHKCLGLYDESCLCALNARMVVMLKGLVIRVMIRVWLEDLCMI